MAASEPESAYGEERSLTLALVNTLVTGASRQIDRIPDSTSLTQWLRSHHVATMPAFETAWEQVTAVRSFARALLEALEAGRPLPIHVIDAVNRIAATTPVHPELTQQRHLRLEPSTDTPSIAATLAVDLIQLITSTEADQIRTCAAADCDRMFIQDHKRRVWCSTRCGSRMRARRHATSKRTTTNAR
ncbi:hypothetical protein GCM10027568_30090 [Humibacter soli]